MNSFDYKLQAIHDRIDAVKAQVGRNDTVHLCAVSKMQPAEAVRAAYEAGQTIFGENYLQEALFKQEKLQDCDIEWHFIGPIQSNKTQAIAQHFSWAHSVDRIKIAQRLSSARAGHAQPLNICLQFNSSNETTKSGASSEEIISLAEVVQTLPNLNLRGIMALPKSVDSVKEQRAQFKLVHTIFEQLNNKGFGLDALSIGMSNDYEAAIMEGGTIIRIGSAIFGPRPHKNTSSE